MSVTASVTAKILLVEDDASLAEMFELVLTSAGHHVVKATNGAEALTLASSEAPDLIIMDMDLPVITGFKAIQKIKSDGEAGSVRILALSAYKSQGDMDEAWGAGCDAYEKKPISNEKLLSVVSSLL